MLRRAAGIGILLVIAGVLWWTSRPEPSNENQLSQNVPPSVEATARSEHGAEKKEPRLPRKANVKRVDDGRRAELLKALQDFEWKAMEAAHGDHENDDNAVSPVAHEPTKLVSKAYIQEQIEGIRPMLFDCYKQAKKVDPSLASKVPVSFTIGGDPDVGGVVTEAALGKGFEKQTELNECIRDTLFDLEIDPPEDGGEVGVRYPFDFSEDEEA